MIKYVILHIAMAGAIVADPIFYATSTNTWSQPLEISVSEIASGSGSVEPTGGADSGAYYSLTVPTVNLPPGAVVQSDVVFVSHDATVTNTSENIQTVPIDPTLPYAPFEFIGGWYWSVLCSYDPGGICALDQSHGVALYPPFPDGLSGTYDITWESNTGGAGAQGGVNASSTVSITTDFTLTVSAEHMIGYSLPVPEPVPAVVMGLSLLCLGVLRKRRTLQ